MKLAVVLLGCVLGCDNAVCVDSVCADPDETRRFPGPCVSRRHEIDPDSKQETTYDGSFEYDAARNLTHVTRTFDGWGGPMSDTRVHSFSETHWTYDANGDLLAINGPTNWAFDAQRVTYTAPGTTTVYDRSTFAFLPIVDLEDLASPRAIFGAISTTSGGTTTAYTWSRDGQTVTRISTRSSDGRVTTDYYDLDVRDRVVRWRSVDGIRETYVYEGDLLVDFKTPFLARHFTYDRGGNLIQSEFENETRNPMVYSYECWD